MVMGRARCSKERMIMEVQGVWKRGESSDGRFDVRSLSCRYGRLAAREGSSSLLDMFSRRKTEKVCHGLWTNRTGRRCIPYLQLPSFSNAQCYRSLVPERRVEESMLSINTSAVMNARM